MSPPASLTRPRYEPKPPLSSARCSKPNPRCARIFMACGPTPTRPGKPRPSWNSPWRKYPESSSQFIVHSARTRHTGTTPCNRARLGKSKTRSLQISRLRVRNEPCVISEGGGAFRPLESSSPNGGLQARAPFRLKMPRHGIEWPNNGRAEGIHPWGRRQPPPDRVVLDIRDPTDELLLRHDLGLVEAAHPYVQLAFQ